LRIVPALLLVLAASAHAQAVTRIEVSTTSDDILVYGPVCAANVPAVIRESDKNFKTIVGLLHRADRDHGPHHHDLQRWRRVPDWDRQDRGAEVGATTVR
jgi:hypothetical protein